MILTPNDTYSFLLYRHRRRTVLSLSVYQIKDRDLETSIEKFFGERGMVAVSDWRTEYPDISDSLRTWRFYLPEGATAAVRLCASVLTELYGVTEEGGLSFVTDALS